MIAIIALVWTCFAAVIFSAPVTEELYLPQKAPVVYGEPGPRVSFFVTCNICICLLSGLLGEYDTSPCQHGKSKLKAIGYRIRVLSSESFRRITLTQVYVFILYGLSMGFVLAAAIADTGLGLATQGICKAAMRICIVFYAGSKVSM
jgi:hypothetical protein